MEEELKNRILKLTQQERIIKVENIQELWSGYGKLQRIYLNDKRIIIKHIQFPNKNCHPRGWNNEISHQRKAQSYNVEINWYRQTSKEVNNARIPKYIASSSNNDETEKYLILEDLGAKGFSPAHKVSFQEIKNCLEWLAHFHRAYLNRNIQGIWSIGTYWHLDTRPDELEALDDFELKNAAKKIDQKLNQAQHKTIVHGDAKVANFLFAKDSVAALDFQYVGGGVGIKDVAYFLSSVFSESELEKNADDCLDIYFQELGLPKVEEEWRELYPWAWCDFYRFLKGWAPGHYKINNYSEKMKDMVLKWI